MRALALLVSISLLTLFISPFASAQQTGTISGRVFDRAGAVIPGATVTAVEEGAKEQSVTTDGQGEFVIKGLTPGRYTVLVSAPNFSAYENKALEVRGGQAQELKVVLAVPSIKEDVQVTNAESDIDPEAGLGAVVIRGSLLASLPEDPDAFADALLAFAGPSFDADGAGISVDGFSGGRIPPKSAIREVRINRSSFSAEYDRLGSGSIEIFTKPGTSKFRGQGFLNFNDARLNSRSPFALTRLPGQSRFSGGSVSGPIQEGKSSFFLNLNNRQIDQSRVINASVLDQSLNVAPLRQEVLVPLRAFSIASRVDYKLNTDNTLVFGYDLSKNRSDNQGVSGLSLPSRAYQTSNLSQDFRLTETMIVNPKTVNETRLGFTLNSYRQEGDTSLPAINVTGAFLGGGSQIGLNFTDTSRLELQNYTSMMWGKGSRHALKFGARLRRVSIEDRSEADFGGVFTFAGVRDSQTGALLFSSIEQYRQKLLGNPDPRFNPNQFTISAGNPLNDISQSDVGLFVNDDWRVRKNLTLSFGLRYERQTNISDGSDFAPRFGFAYALDGGDGKPAETVVRGGFGIFYSRLNENFFLQARRFDGNRQTQYVVSDPSILGQPVFTLGGVTNVPTVAQLTDFARAGSLTVRRLDQDLVSPLSYQFALSVDRKLPKGTSVSLSYFANRTLDMLGTRNINAPVCPPLQECSADAPRPDLTQGNVYLYESFGVQNQQQLILNFNSNLIRNVSFGGNYRLSSAKGNTDGAGSFPAYSYDLRSEYGSSSLDVRHNFSFYGSFQLPWKIRMNPLINISSGRPFNITTGVDANRDSIFNDRPTFAQLLEVCARRGLSDSFCDGRGMADAGTTVIPRNFGRGPAFSMVNLNLNRSFALKLAGDRPYNLNLGVQVSNLLNHTNQGAPIGNLSSDRFGQPYSGADFYGGGGAANRRVSLQISFSF